MIRLGENSNKTAVGAVQIVSAVWWLRWYNTACLNHWHFTRQELLRGSQQGICPGKSMFLLIISGFFQNSSVDSVHSQYPWIWNHE